MFALAALVVFVALVYGLYLLDERTNGAYNRQWHENRRRERIRRELVEAARRKAQEKKETVNA